ncbi:MAG: hypothetical protein M0R06_06460, partial [Sphaerochaeta sp.]|nr:hypothetical protein [Sphaerochaeta sp.]
MVLQNYVILEEGIPAKLHFFDHHIESRTITDPATGQPGIRKVLVFEVDYLNDKPVVGRYSTMSEKHALDFSPYLPTKDYKYFDFIITMRGEGFRRSYT